MNIKAVKANKSHSVSGIFKDYGVIVGIIILFLIFQIINNKFLNPNNILGVVNSSSFVLIMSLGLMMSMVVRGIDLSVAQIADAAAVISCMVLVKGGNAYAAILAGLMFGAFVGLFNAILMAYLGIPSLIGTMGTMFIVRSFELVISNGAQPQMVFPLPKTRTAPFLFVGQGSIGPIPFMIVLAAVIFMIMYFVRERSALGRHMDAIAGNVRTAYLSGINIRKVFGSAYVFSGVLAALAGIMIGARGANAVPKNLESYLNDCFIAVFVGTLLSRNNRFNVAGTLVGTLFVCFVANFITLQGMGNDMKNILNGVFVIGAVALNILKSKKR